jgi:hypothetical protein
MAETVHRGVFGENVVGDGACVRQEVVDAVGGVRPRVGGVAALVGGGGSVAGPGEGFDPGVPIDTARWDKRLFPDPGASEQMLRS